MGRVVSNTVNFMHTGDQGPGGGGCFGSYPLGMTLNVHLKQVLSVLVVSDYSLWRFVSLKGQYKEKFTMKI